ncbi:MAG: glycosyltransferase family 39 protein [Chloroflexi bacterium]|nr:glycosyltransferase family 39 protein [Chloroflexota bacterium]
MSRIQKANWVLIVIVILGLMLRLWGIGFGLPYMYNPDEGVPLGVSLRFLQTGDLNPHVFAWPSLSYYLNALVLLGYFAWGRLAGVFTTPADLLSPDFITIAVAKAQLPAELWLGRALTAVVGTLSIFWVYAIGRQLSNGKLVARTAALFLAVELIDVQNSQLIRPDTLAVFFALWTIFFALKIVDQPTLRNYVLAGIGLGLATSSKYNLIFAVLPLLVAHFIRFGRRLLFRREIFIAAVASVVTFFLTTPFALFDVSTFWHWFTFDASHYSGGQLATERTSYRWYLTLLWNTQGWILFAAAAQAIRGVLVRSPKEIALLSFIVLYTAFVGLFQLHYDSTILPVIPLVLILAAQFVDTLVQWSERLTIRQSFRTASVAILIAFFALPLARASAARNELILQPDGRENARQWIDAQLAPGSRIALEPYSPFVDKKKFNVDGYFAVQDHTPDWYVANGFEYLIFSQGVYGQFFAEPERYGAELDQLNSFFSRFHEAARFNQSNFEIRILKTNAILPSHRVAARYGDSGDLVELVGYDTVDWKSGEPLKLKMTWRPVGDKPEPFQVELRLLDDTDREVGRTSSDLFQNKGWQPGMFEGTWTIQVPADTVPGNYRVQVDVVWTRYAYRAPAMTWGEEKIEPVLIGPFELKAK